MQSFASGGGGGREEVKGGMFALLLTPLRSPVYRLSLSLVRCTRLDLAHAAYVQGVFCEDDDACVYLLYTFAWVSVDISHRAAFILYCCLAHLGGRSSALRLCTWLTVSLLLGCPAASLGLSSFSFFSTFFPVTGVRTHILRI